MSKILIIYFSKTGNTERMAHLVAEGVKGEGVAVEVKKVANASVDELLDAKGIIIGSPTYFGTMAAEIKSFLDESVKHFGKLKGKIGAGFSSSALIGGGNETTVLAILKALLIHGMIVQGETEGGHYGPVAIGAPDKRCSEECKKLGQKVAQLVKRLD
ncbi:MAG: flavodoxin [Deltaproteobacteria bacterium DG_8]|nr:MAG: flavodoxin [Deltaproteobacteria bacterium DG_8]